MSSNNDKKLETLSHDAIVRALFENYESIYVVDAETSAYRCFHESGSYSSLRIEDRGYDFFQSMENNIEIIDIFSNLYYQRNNANILNDLDKYFILYICSLLDKDVMKKYFPGIIIKVFI